VSIMDYVRGEVTEKEPERIVLETGGIGFELIIHPGFMNRLPALGETARVYSHLHVREDILQLFGFPGPEEKALFLQLINVSGVGPKVALTITGSLDPGVFALAVMNSDVERLMTVKGIGKKSAERLIVEMKDKVKKTLSGTASAPVRQIVPGSMSEAMEALLVLGYRQDEAEAALMAANPGPEDDAENVIRQSLQWLAKKRDAR